MEEGEERGEDPKEEGEGDEGKEREEKDDSDQTPADSILGSSCHALIFPFSPLGARPPCFGVLFSLHHGSHLTVEGTHGEGVSSPLCSQFILSLLVSTKTV